MEQKFNCPTCRAEYKEAPSHFPVNRFALENQSNETLKQELLFQCNSCSKTIETSDVLEHRLHDVVKMTEELQNKNSHELDDKIEFNDQKHQFNEIKSQIKPKIDQIILLITDLEQKKLSDLNRVDQSVNKLQNQINSQTESIKEEQERVQVEKLTDLKEQQENLKQNSTKAETQLSNINKELPINYEISLEQLKQIDYEEVDSRISEFISLKFLLPDIITDTNYDIIDNQFSIRYNTYNVNTNTMQHSNISSNSISNTCTNTQNQHEHDKQDLDTQSYKIIENKDKMRSECTREFKDTIIDNKDVNSFARDVSTKHTQNLNFKDTLPDSLKRLTDITKNNKSSNKNSYINDVKRDNFTTLPETVSKIIKPTLKFQENTLFRKYSHSPNDNTILETTCNADKISNNTQNSQMSNKNKNNSKRTIPGKGEPHFNTQTLISKLQNIKQVERVGHQLETILSRSKSPEYKNDYRKNFNQRMNTERNVNVNFDKEEGIIEGKKKVLGKNINQNNEKQYNYVKNKVLKDINLTKIDQNGEMLQIQDLHQIPCVECGQKIVKVNQRQCTRLKCGHCICRPCKYKSTDIVENKIFRCCSITTKFEVKK